MYQHQQKSSSKHQQHHISMASRGIKNCGGSDDADNVLWPCIRGVVICRERVAYHQAAYGAYGVWRMAA